MSLTQVYRQGNGGSEGRCILVKVKRAKAALSYLSSDVSQAPEPSTLLCAPEGTPICLVRREMSLSQGQGQGGTRGGQVTQRILSPPGPAYATLVPSLPNPKALATTCPTFV